MHCLSTRDLGTHALAALRRRQGGTRSRQGPPAPGKGRWSAWWRSTAKWCRRRWLSCVLSLLLPTWKHSVARKRGLEACSSLKTGALQIGSGGGWWEAEQQLAPALAHQLLCCTLNWMSASKWEQLKQQAHEALGELERDMDTKKDVSEGWGPGQLAALGVRVQHAGARCKYPPCGQRWHAGGQGAHPDQPRQAPLPAYRHPLRGLQDGGPPATAVSW